MPYPLAARPAAAEPRPDPSGRADEREDDEGGRAADGGADEELEGSGARMKRGWGVDEDARLVDAVQRHGERNWSLIARQVGTRRDKQCRERWYNHLSPAVRKGDWTAVEDEMILRQVGDFGKKWSQIAMAFPGRTAHAVKNRYNLILRWQRSVQERRAAGNDDGSGALPPALPTALYAGGGGGGGGGGGAAAAAAAVGQPGAPMPASVLGPLPGSQPHGPLPQMPVMQVALPGALPPGVITVQALAPPPAHAGSGGDWWRQQTGAPPPQQPRPVAVQAQPLGAQPQHWQQMYAGGPPSAAHVVGAAPGQPMPQWASCAVAMPGHMAAVAIAQPQPQPLPQPALKRPPH